MEWLQDVAPKGVDCFFDNVGGLQASLIINSMNSFGRVAICGHISTYNEQDPPLVPAISHSILMKVLMIRLKNIIFNRSRSWFFTAIKN